MITLVLGGARSGKSRFALELANNFIFSKEGVRGGDRVSPTLKKAYVATAQALDEEMKERIEKHKKERSGEWATFEEPMNISTLISDINRSYDVILVDCLTLWLSNLLLNNKNVEAEIESFISSLSTIHCSLFTVSNEVGLGIVPDNALSRRFRDLSGYLNQKIASVADEVYLVTAGIPMKIR
ncbi:MAG: bifunctional adenosylcobinamide kinase/adenosylcobinamide-phosphate guanylyltransferase [Nitrospirae bacterium]|nr:bifunctional adenosylcobinamide kinase/adenosylcobinamide-phosphate guanylyltransferase [Nitrospirota bacterium]MCL5062681.1 bifunctional adenosylcobinamide kinase/adenosylcobinamide-phosphate guanylyltransferase [Nitrospirota bacterium]MDA8215533.1 bifunctional adenosylcobinamide kinase/adenosylcobinamide-phosphate guanylyltransferase [Nitrospiraceae bacterium]MDA8337774.1 bifunctional adenosylcobinamide kinase/adenosylcobinamide-phosphate guanylyltransferase [Nitrospiraceae bacterium]